MGHKWQSKDLNPDLAGLQGQDLATVPNISPECLQLAQISDFQRPMNKGSSFSLWAVYDIFPGWERCLITHLFKWLQIQRSLDEPRDRVNT